MDPPRTLQRFLRVFLPLSLVLAIALAVHVRVELELLRTRTLASERLAVDLGAGALTHDLASVASDVEYLATSMGLRQAVVDDRPINLALLATEFASFSLSMRVYDQLRWLDETGMERVRVDRVDDGARIVPDEALQNKAARDYFIDSMRFDPGEIYVSPLELDVDNGQVDTPHKPVLRVATPVSDGAGRARGVVVASYRADHLLTAFREATAGATAPVMLLNRDGYWLLAPDPDDEWGFMLARPERTLAQRAPEVWVRIAGGDSGQMMRADGLWTWRTVRPLRGGLRAGPAAISPRAARAAADYVWKVVGHLPAAQLAAAESGLRARLAAIVGALLLLAAWASWKSAQTGRTRQLARDALRAANVRLEQTVRERTRELSERIASLDHANARLRDADETLAVILSASLDGYLHSGPDGRLINVNDTYCRLSGYARAELLAMRFADLDDLEAPAAAAAHIGRVAASGHDQFESVHRRKDGSRWHVEVSAMHAPGGGGVHAFVRDISERKRIEHDRLESERRFRDIASASADWIWEVDANGMYTYASDGVSRVLGYAPDELLGKTPFDFMAPDEAARVGAAIADLAAARASFSDLRNEVIGKDGQVHVTLTNGVPILDDDGRFHGYRGIDRDVTERERMQENIRQLAYMDTLTGLPNRRLLDDRLGQALAASNRLGHFGAVIFIDLDNFKPLNDAHGHEAGDLLLVETAARLKRHVRVSDTVARLGGDEFVVILTALTGERSTSMAQCQQVAAKILDALAQPYDLAPPGRPAFTHRCTASLGVAMFSGRRAEPGELLRRADQAMYDAKKAGRNTIRFAADVDADAARPQ